MLSSPPDPSANNTQLVRYHIALPRMTTPDSLVAVRELLQAHHLIVDRVTPGEALVTSATGTEPEWPAIKSALKTAGFPDAHATTVEE